MCYCQKLSSVGTMEDGRVDGRIRNHFVFDGGEGCILVVVDLEGREATVPDGNAFVQAKQVAMLDINLEPGSVGRACNICVKVYELVR